jgi:hypothetical protein
VNSEFALRAGGQGAHGQGSELGTGSLERIVRLLLCGLCILLGFACTGLSFGQGGFQIAGLADKHGRNRSEYQGQQAQNDGDVTRGLALHEVRSHG